MVAASFGLAYENVNKAVLLRSLETYFRSCVQEGRRVLLVVDEAQNLPKRAIEELRMLSNFQMNGKMLVQSFLLGQREFRTTMRSEGFEQLRQRVIAAYHLRPLDPGETQGYVEHRLTVAGWTGRPRFTPDTYQGIYEFTLGVPRRVNTLCDRLLLFGSLEKLETIDEEALAAVTGDIIEEQGGPDLDAPRSTPVTNAAPAAQLETAVPDSSDDLRISEDHAGVARHGQRLSEVEKSVASLADSIKDELSMLRQSLGELRKKSDKDKGE
jgi:general secretion pathway protein A